jgi:TRAP-type mannitol/chloroaromatic compound transport system permease small subunit
MIVLRGLVRAIDWLAEWTGRVVSWVGVLIMLTMTFEVIMRYVFNNPTKWSYDTTIMMGGVLFILSTAYVLLHKAHVRVDIFYAKFSPFAQATVDLIFTVLYLFGAMYVFTSQGWHFAFWSLKVHEISQFGYWEPTMVPFRFLVAYGFSLLALETLSWFTKNLFFIITRRELMQPAEGGSKP